MVLVTNRDKIRLPDPEFDLSTYETQMWQMNLSRPIWIAFIEPGKILRERLHAANDGAGASPIYKAYVKY